MSVYAVDKLMAQTRKLAADFRQMTGQPLPVTAEIANFDRGAMPVARFRRIARLAWCREEGTVDDGEIWENTPGS